ncbi:hypothetical protein [Nostoc sp. 'Peltigera membranacea cyanobiont' 232]|uniref:hypothetical protein n=1 Tax=Nostoc sp. 'Peltigera membranacea cyanobiont' 232 TaxID=2014531 RepID=UPI00295005BF|nr:hypothetical protein [Nostoc sp. 'Peltigera membranacea cyanobiont' 232]
MNTNKNAIKSGNFEPFEPKPDCKVSVEQSEHPIVYPNNLTAAEYHELLTGSAIHPALIERNFFHVEGESVYDFLFISDKIPRKNAGRVTDRYIRQYQHLLLGGTWIQSLDPFKNWQPMEWGRIVRFVD